MGLLKRCAIVTLLVAGTTWLQATPRADSAMYGDDHFGQGEWWSVDGKNGGGTRLEWHNPGSNTGDVMLVRWTAFGGAWTTANDGPHLSGLGTHRKQSGPADDQVSEMYFTIDGNLLMLANDGRGVLWQTYTGGNWGGFFNLQGDGNLVVYSSSVTPLWSLF